MGFNKNDQGRVICYTDGCCFNNGCDNPSAGYAVVFGINHPENRWGAVRGRATNNVAEIKAAIEAINVANDLKIDSMLIKTDSRFIVDAWNKWILRWTNNNWKKVNGDPVKNQEQFKVLLDVVKRNKIDVNFVHITRDSHTLNKEADRLAKKGAGAQNM